MTSSIGVGKDRRTAAKRGPYCGQFTTRGSEGRTSNLLLKATGFNRTAQVRGPTSDIRSLRPVAGGCAFARGDAVANVSGFARDVVAGFFSTGGSQQQAQAYADAESQQGRSGGAHQAAVFAADHVGGAADPVGRRLIGVLCSRT